jgi:3-phosphoinositide dependent protein kinase-1
MLSGTSPFKDASEWLIFQRIIAREIRFPDYFSDEARDLIDRLLVSTLLLDTIIQIYHP